MAINLKSYLFLFLWVPFLLQGQQMYMTITGANQGNISFGAGTSSSIGLFAQAGHADEILVLAMEQDIFVNTDPVTGTPTDAPRLGTLKIKKYTDRASPLLAQSSADLESLNFTIKFWRPTGNGNEQHYFTISCTNSIIVNYRFLTPDLADTNTSNAYNAEEITFRIVNINYKHEITGTQSGF